MASPPLLTAKQFRLIEDELPINRRDRVVTSAILYRATSGQCLREVSDAFGVSRARLNDWETALASSLPDVMRKLRLTLAPASMSRRSGIGWRRKPEVYAAVTNLRLQEFGEALRRTAR